MTSAAPRPTPRPTPRFVSELELELELLLGPKYTLLKSLNVDIDPRHCGSATAHEDGKFSRKFGVPSPLQFVES